MAKKPKTPKVTKEDDAQNTAILQNMEKNDAQDKMDNIQNDAIIEGMIKDDEQDAKIKEVDEKTAAEIKRVEAKSDRNDAMQKDKDDAQDKDIKDVKNYVSNVAEIVYNAAQASNSADAAHDAKISSLKVDLELAKDAATVAFKETEKLKSKILADENAQNEIINGLTKSCKRQKVFNICLVIFLIAEAIIFAL